MCCNHHEILWRLVQAISSMRSVEIHFSEFGRFMGDRIKIVHVVYDRGLDKSRTSQARANNEREWTTLRSHWCTTCSLHHDQLTIIQSAQLDDALRFD